MMLEIYKNHLLAMSTLISATYISTQLLAPMILVLYHNKGWVYIVVRHLLLTC